MVVGLCYNSPTSCSESKAKLNETVKHATDKYSDLIICGDFNYGIIDWNTLHAENESGSFLDTVKDSFLIQHVKEPTREQSVLDLVLSKENVGVDNVKVHSPLGQSDHSVVHIDLFI